MVCPLSFYFFLLPDYNVIFIAAFAIRLLNEESRFQPFLGYLLTVDIFCMFFCVTVAAQANGTHSNSDDFFILIPSFALSLFNDTIVDEATVANHRFGSSCM